MRVVEIWDGSDIGPDHGADWIFFLPLADGYAERPTVPFAGFTVLWSVRVVLELDETAGEVFSLTQTMQAGITIPTDRNCAVSAVDQASAVLLQHSPSWKEAVRSEMY